MPNKWIGCIHRGQVGKRWTPREKANRYNPEDKSCNARRLEYDMQLHAEFLTAPTKDDWPSCVQRVKLLSTSTRAR